MSWNELVMSHPVELSFDKMFDAEVVDFNIELEGWSGFWFRGTVVTQNSHQLKMLVAGDNVGNNYRRHHHVAKYVMQTSAHTLYGSHALVAPDLFDSGLTYYHIEGTYFSCPGHFMYQVNQRGDETSPVSSTIYTVNGNTLYMGTGDKNIVNITSNGQPVSGLLKIFKFY